MSTGVNLRFTNLRANAGLVLRLARPGAAASVTRLLSQRLLFLLTCNPVFYRAACTPFFVVKVSKMKLVGPSSATASSSTPARARLKLDRHLMPRSIPVALEEHQGEENDQQVQPAGILDYLGER